ncbi:MAG: NADPH-dependent F420 reductase [Chloroflexi bacterium]|nr:NADPH-dependent F420 reductase [Chloroflexota bacterium]
MVLDNTKTLAILGGTGKEGPGLALRWAKAGYHVIVGSRSAEKAQATAAEINAQLGIDTVRGMENADAARTADISVLTVVHSAHAEALAGVKEAVRGKILVDATARVDFKDARPPGGKAAAREAQELLGPEVRVVAAFQNVPAHALKNLDRELSSDVLVCSDDAEARAEVVKLAEAGGMKAYEAGGLDNAVVVEGLTALLIAINKRYKSKTGGIQITGVTQ